MASGKTIRDPEPLSLRARAVVHLYARFSLPCLSLRAARAVGVGVGVKHARPPPARQSRFPQENGPLPETAVPLWGSAVSGIPFGIGRGRGGEGRAHPDLDAAVQVTPGGHAVAGHGERLAEGLDPRQVGLGHARHQRPQPRQDRLGALLRQSAIGRRTAL